MLTATKSISPLYVKHQAKVYNLSKKAYNQSKMVTNFASFDDAFSILYVIFWFED